jgi:hypothetical protein
MIVTDNSDIAIWGTDTRTQEFVFRDFLTNKYFVFVNTS